MAAVAFNRNKWVEFYEPLIERAAPFPPSFATVDEPTWQQPVPAGVRALARLTQDATVVVTGHDPGERRATLTPMDTAPMDTAPMNTKELRA